MYVQPHYLALYLRDSCLVLGPPSLAGSGSVSSYTTGLLYVEEAIHIHAEDSLLLPEIRHLR